MTSESWNERTVRRARERFADALAHDCGPTPPALREAFARVPRERFLGDGPWLVSSGDGYRRTPDANPAHVYADVRVALDARRELNNGRPLRHARWLRALDARPGQRVVHLGAGTGYYSAILAELVGETGRVTALEIDPQLAAALADNLRPYPQARAVRTRGLELEFEPVDRIYVNAAVAHLPRALLDRLLPEGRALLPIAVVTPEPRGFMSVVHRAPSGFALEFLDAVRIYPCTGAHEPGAEGALNAALDGGGQDEVRSARVDPHRAEASCWLHAAEVCLSRLRP